MRKPRALRPGDRVAIVAPASPFAREEFDAGLTELRVLGFEPVYEESVFLRQGYVAGPAAARAEAWRRAWDDPIRCRPDRRAGRLRQRPTVAGAGAGRGRARNAESVHRLQRQHLDSFVADDPARCRLDPRSDDRRAPRARGGGIRSRDLPALSVRGGTDGRGVSPAAGDAPDWRSRWHAGGRHAHAAPRLAWHSLCVQPAAWRGAVPRRGRRAPLPPGSHADAAATQRAAGANVGRGVRRAATLRRAGRRARRPGRWCTRCWRTIRARCCSVYLPGTRPARR